MSRAYDLPGKRQILSDDEDDEVPQPVKKSTPKKPPPKKQQSVSSILLVQRVPNKDSCRKRESPVGEATTTSEYFASSGKSKPTRSTPTKAKSKNAVEGKAPSTKSTPKVVITPKSETVANAKSSTRKKTKKPNYVVDDEEDDAEDDAFEPKVIEDEDESGDDVFEADFKGGRRGGKDAYRESDDEVVTKPVKKKSTTPKKSAPARPPPDDDDDDDDDDDIRILEIPMKDIPEYKESKPSKSSNGTKGRKRKSVEVDEDEDDFLDDDAAPASKKTKASKAKSPTKKATPKSKKVEEPRQKTAVDDILDSITTVRAPTPPPKEPGKKFDWKANAARGAGSSSGGPSQAPVGASNCLAGLSFVFTGVLQTLEREAGQELVKRYGGKVTGAPSKKTSFVVLGDDAGPKKLATIQEYSIKTIDEHGLFELISKLPANGGDGKAGEAFEAKARKEAEKVEKEAREMEKLEKAAAKEAKAREEARLATRIKDGVQPTSNNKSALSDGRPAVDSRLWTVKYAPTATSMICGNKGQVDKLQAWLRSWPHSVAKRFKMPGKDGTGVFRAMILHGPPGIGKTTAAHLAAKLEGYDVVESNASDTRSKKLVESGLKGVLDTTSLNGYFAGDGQKVDSGKKKLVLIMDEVDGMSAGDRGGVGALATVCRKTTVPIILICNDRKLPKMRPFDSVAYDLPFRRPTVDQIRSRIMTICFREGLKISPQVINALIEGSRADIRQVINMLSTAKLDVNAEGMDFDKGKKMSESWEKNIILKPWDIVSKILGGGMFASSSTSKLNDKIELYFNDHEFSSLMLQENYLGTNPMLANQYTGKERALKQLELVDQAALSISDGDLVDRMIHGSQQQWSLMPTHAVFSFVRPASFVAGSMAGHQTRFTSWLGQNSKLGMHASNPFGNVFIILTLSPLHRQTLPVCQRDPRPYAPPFLRRPPRDPSGISPSSLGAPRQRTARERQRCH